MRVDLPGMDAKRVDLMPAAAMLVDFVLQRNPARPSWSHAPGRCARALLLGLRARDRSRRSAADARRRSVGALATRFAGANDHGRQVARLALKLFDATAPVLGLPKVGENCLNSRLYCTISATRLIMTGTIVILTT